tara:strand:- start:456 stop:1145 length:690 start_codon:yes stop_codon:yes gene_type:complete
LLINIKIHSAYNKFFEEKEYTFDAYIAADIMHYLKAMHPKFSKYMTQIGSGDSDESFSLLDSNLKEITEEMLELKHFKDGDTIHLVPNICGGGGKSGRKMFMIAAILMLAITPGGQALAIKMGTAMKGALAAGKGMSMLGSMALNIGMSIIGRMFTKSPAARQAQKTTESTTRDNGMFGSLTNSSESGTPIALIYGQHRVAGQFLSGYISSIPHGSGDQISVGAQFDGD